MNNKVNFLIWRRFTLREAILLGFCATFIVVTRAGLRLHLHLPGHAMFFLMFFLLLARGCVQKTGAATLVGLIAGLVSVMLGITGSPLILIKFLIPALLVDIGGLLYPGFPVSYWASILLGVTATALRALSITGLEWLVGMETEIIVQKALLTALVNALYGGCGAALVPAIVRRLQANNLLSGD
jgi:hypothetical protein